MILEALDCIVVEIFDIYSRIRRATSIVLTRIYESAGTSEVTLALKIMRTAESQQDQLCSYFKFCRSMGVLNFKNDPTLKPLSEDIRKLEQMLATGGLAKFDLDQKTSMSLVVADQKTDRIARNKLKTIITSEWQVFDDDYSSTNPFLSSGQAFLALEPPQSRKVADELPDLISFD